MTRLGWMVPAIVACAEPSPAPPQCPDPGDAVGYCRDVQPIWDRWCIECHAVNAYPGLTRESAAEDLARASGRCRNDAGSLAPFVVAGDPGASFLYYKLTGDNAAAFTGLACDRMMPANTSGGGTALQLLDPDAVATVRRWIQDGAQLD